MPPTTIDVRRSDDVRDVVHRAVQVLVEGHLLVVPTETDYALAASACHPAAVARLSSAAGSAASRPLTLAIKSEAEALDWLPELGPLARRFARRAWPGPLVLVHRVPERDGLFERLPPGVQQTLAPDGELALRAPASSIVLDVLQMLTGPVVFAPLRNADGSEAITLQQALAAGGGTATLALDTGPSQYRESASVIRIESDRYHIVHEGALAGDVLARLAMLSVVLVCTGNTCRSPLAEAIFRRQFAAALGCDPTPGALEVHGVQVCSAGLAAMSGDPASPESVDIAREWDVDLSSHRSQPLMESLLHQADRLITMTRSHRRAILDSFPDAAGRTTLLMPGERDVPDPIGGPRAVYEACAAQIALGCDHHLPSLLAMLPERG